MPKLKFIKISIITINASIKKSLKLSFNLHSNEQIPESTTPK